MCINFVSYSYQESLNVHYKKAEKEMKEGFLVHIPYEDVFEYDDFSTLNSILKKVAVRS